MRIHDAGGPLANEEFAAVFHYERGETARGGCGSFIKIWKITDAIILKSEAMFRDWTNEALGFARGADERAEFHQGLVEVGAGGGVKRET